MMQLFALDASGHMWLFMLTLGVIALLSLLAFISARLSGWGFAGCLALGLVIYLGATILLGGHHYIEVDKQRIKVVAGLYQMNLDSAQVKRIQTLTLSEFEQSSLQPLAWKNGYHFANLQAGWYQTASGDSIFLLIDSHQPQLSLIQSAQGPWLAVSIDLSDYADVVNRPSAD